MMHSNLRIFQNTDTFLWEKVFKALCSHRVDIEDILMTIVKTFNYLINFNCFCLLRKHELQNIKKNKCKEKKKIICKFNRIDFLYTKINIQKGKLINFLFNLEIIDFSPWLKQNLRGTKLKDKNINSPKMMEKLNQNTNNWWWWTIIIMSRWNFH